MVEDCMDSMDGRDFHDAAIKIMRRIIGQVVTSGELVKMMEDNAAGRTGRRDARLIRTADGGKEMSAEKKGTVGVIGLGIMGSAMAANLVKSGFEVIGTDIVAQCRDELTKAGGTAVADAREVGKRCRHIILALASEAALNAVCAELASSCAKGTIVIETGTLPLAAKLKVRDQLAEKGIVLLDCTLSGTGAQAKNRDLAVYASGDAAAIKEVAPVMDGFARVCYELGEFGNGMKMKLVANLLVAIHNVAAAEAILLGARSGT